MGKRAKREQRKAEREQAQIDRQAEMRARFLADLAAQRCPSCGSARVASILYGLPRFDPELRADLDADRVILGGCSVSDGDPIWMCLVCKTSWGRWVWRSAGAAPGNE